MNVPLVPEIDELEAATEDELVTLELLTTLELLAVLDEEGAAELELGAREELLPMEDKLPSMLEEDIFSELEDGIAGVPPEEDIPLPTEDELLPYDESTAELLLDVFAGQLGTTCPSIAKQSSRAMEMQASLTKHRGKPELLLGSTGGDSTLEEQEENSAAQSANSGQGQALPLHNSVNPENSANSGSDNVQ